MASHSNIEIVAFPTADERTAQDARCESAARDIRRGRLDAAREILQSLPNVRDGLCLGCGGHFVQRLAIDATQGRGTALYLPTACLTCRGERTDEAIAAAADRARATDDAARVARLRDLAPPLDYADASVATWGVPTTDETDAETVRLLTMKRRLALRYVEAWPARATLDAFPRVAIFSGAPGTGKTRLAWAIVRDVVQLHGAKALVTTLGDLVRDLRESWGKREGASEGARLRKYRDADLLVIDEASPDAMMGEPVQHLFDTIAPREANRRPTIITTNANGPQLAAIIRPALTDRASGPVWDFGTYSWRTARAERHPFLPDDAPDETALARARRDIHEDR